MSEHTPGPWRAGYIDEQDRRERMIVRAEAVDGHPYVAICPNPLAGSHEANARLIAAAPDLLAACELMLSSPKYGNAPSEAAVEAARAAIARARGE